MSKEKKRDDSRFEFRPVRQNPDIVKRLRDKAEAMNKDASDIAREAVDAALERLNAGLPIRNTPEEFKTALPGGMLVFPLVDTVQAGPFEVAADQGHKVLIPEWWADMFNMGSRDKLFYVDGQSMEGAGIRDGSWVSVRLLDGRTPNRREATVVEISNGEDYKSTLKHFHSGTPGQPPTLTDGEGNEIEIPEGYDARAVGVVRAVFSTYQP